MKKVYIIDDDRDIVKSMAMALRSNGYEVQAQHDDERVLENVRVHKPDLIVLDVMFPQDSSAGFGIARMLKKDEALAKIPILMLSAINERGSYIGRFSDQDIDESWLPVNMFLEKPVSPNALVERVQQLIGR